MSSAPQCDASPAISMTAFRKQYIADFVPIPYNTPELECFWTINVCGETGVRSGE